MKDIIKKQEELISNLTAQLLFPEPTTFAAEDEQRMLERREDDLRRELSVLKSKMEEVTDEDIEKAFPSDLRTLCTQLKIPESLWSSELSDVLKSIQEGNLNKQIGAKAHRDNLIKKI